MLSPALSGLLLTTMGIDFILLIDVFSCLFAILTVAILVTFPGLPAENKEKFSEKIHKTYWQQIVHSVEEMAIGWK